MSGQLELGKRDDAVCELENELRGIAARVSDVLLQNYGDAHVQVAL